MGGGTVMANRYCKGFVALAVLAGVQASAAAYPITASARMSTIRIEPTRPGGVPGEPRESSPFWHSDSGKALTTKPPVKRKGRRR